MPAQKQKRGKRSAQRPESETSASTCCSHHSLVSEKQISRASQVAQMVRNSPAMQETRFDPWVGKIPCRRARQPTPVCLPGKSCGQRSLAGYRSMGLQRVTERLTLPLSNRFPSQKLLHSQSPVCGNINLFLLNNLLQENMTVRSEHPRCLARQLGHNGTSEIYTDESTKGNDSRIPLIYTGSSL